MTSINHPVGSGHHYTDEEMHNVDVAHEHSDVNIRTLLAFGAALVAVVAVAAGLMYGLFQFLAHQAAGRDPELSPYAGAFVPSRALVAASARTGSPCCTIIFLAKSSGTKATPPA